MALFGGKTNIERVVSEVSRFIDEMNLSQIIGKSDITKWKKMNQFGYMNPKKLGFSIYLYVKHDVIRKTELKKLNRLFVLKESKRLISGMMTGNTKEDRVRLKATVIKYLVNMIDYVG